MMFGMIVSIGCKSLVLRKIAPRLIKYKIDESTSLLD